MSSMVKTKTFESGESETIIIRIVIFYAGENVWVSKPVPQVNYTCPPGLEYLTLIDQLIVKQKVERLEILTGFDTKNKYTLKNALGQNVNVWCMKININ